LIESKYLITF